MDKKYLKQSYSSIGIKLGGCKNKSKKTKKIKKFKRKQKYKIIKFSSLL